MGTANSGHVCHNPQHASSPVYVSTSRASSAGDRCSVTRLAGEVHVQFSTISPAHQSHSETMDHPGGQSDTNCPLCCTFVVVFDLLSQQGYVSEGMSPQLSKDTGPA